MLKKLLALLPTSRVPTNPRKLEGFLRKVMSALADLIAEGGDTVVIPGLGTFTVVMPPAYVLEPRSGERLTRRGKVTRTVEFTPDADLTRRLQVPAPIPSQIPQTTAPAQKMKVAKRPPAMRRRAPRGRALRRAGRH